MPGTPSPFASLHGAHAEKLQKFAEKREASRQRKLKEYESLVTPVGHASPAQIAEMCHLLCEHGRLRDEHLKEERQRMLKKEKAALSTPFNNSTKKINFKKSGSTMIADDAPWEAWFEFESQHLERMAKKRQEIIDSETACLEDESVHRDKTHKSGDEYVFKRLHQESENRAKRFFERQRQEVANELELALRTCRIGTKADMEAISLRYHEEAERRRKRMEVMQKKTLDKILEDASRGLNFKALQSPKQRSEARAAALEHAAQLHKQWETHQSDLAELQEAYQEAQDELIRRQSVHPQASENWGREAVDELVSRLSRPSLSVSWSAAEPARHPDPPEPKPKLKPRAKRESTLRAWHRRSQGSFKSPFNQPVPEDQDAGLPPSRSKVKGKAKAKPSAKAEAEKAATPLSPHTEDSLKDSGEEDAGEKGADQDTAEDGAVHEAADEAVHEAEDDAREDDAMENEGGEEEEAAEEDNYDWGSNDDDDDDDDRGENDDWEANPEKEDEECVDRALEENRDEGGRSLIMGMNATMTGDPLSTSPSMAIGRPSIMSGRSSVPTR